MTISYVVVALTVDIEYFRENYSRIKFYSVTSYLVQNVPHLMSR